jgi:hypothetical protein
MKLDSKLAGTRLAPQLVLVPEHLMLIYTCFKIGAIIAPLDLRLTETEVVRDINKIEPKAFFFLGNTPVKDFRKVGTAVQQGCSCVEHLVQFTPDPKAGDIIDKAVSISALMDKKRLIWLKVTDFFTGGLKKAYARVETRTPALIIYTTGTTGEPKPLMTLPVSRFDVPCERTDPQAKNCRTTRPVKSATTRPLSFWAILISPKKQEKLSPQKEFSTPGIWDISDRWTDIGHCIYPAGKNSWSNKKAIMSFPERWKTILPPWTGWIWWMWWA